MAHIGNEGNFLSLSKSGSETRNLVSEPDLLRDKKFPSLPICAMTLNHSCHSAYVCSTCQIFRELMVNTYVYITLRSTVLYPCIIVYAYTKYRKLSQFVMVFP